MLNATESRNLDLIRVAEASKHETVQPGDMRYWRTRTLTREEAWNTQRRGVAGAACRG